MTPARRRRTRPGDWVVFVAAGVEPSEPRPHGYCPRCGDRMPVILPMDLTVFVALIRAYVKAHQHCRLTPSSPL